MIERDPLNAELEQLRAENERLQAHATSMINAMKVENEQLEAECNEFKRDLRRRRSENQRLKALLEKLQWTSIDKDNMEFRCDTTCYVMDEIRRVLETNALGLEP